VATRGTPRVTIGASFRIVFLGESAILAVTGILLLLFPRHDVISGNPLIGQPLLVVSHGPNSSVLGIHHWTALAMEVTVGAGVIIALAQVVTRRAKREPYRSRPVPRVPVVGWLVILALAVALPTGYQLSSGTGTGTTLRVVHVILLPIALILGVVLGWAVRHDLRTRSVPTQRP
jgi:hypothetical protein